jgi:hypothetical protein
MPSIFTATTFTVTWAEGAWAAAEKAKAAITKIEMVRTLLQLSPFPL